MNRDVPENSEEEADSLKEAYRRLYELLDEGNQPSSVCVVMQMQRIEKILDSDRQDE